MKYYWTTKDGTKVDVDEMSTDHLRNALKMILRKLDTAKSKPKPMGNIEYQFQEAEWRDWENEQEEDIHPDSSYGQWMKRFNTKLPQDTDGCSNDRSKCSCKNWGGCPVD